MTLKIGVLGCSRVAEKYFFPYISSSKIAEQRTTGRIRGFKEGGIASKPKKKAMKRGGLASKK